MTNEQMRRLPLTAIEVEPPTPVYGCGCSATTAPSWVGGLLFFGLLGLRHRR